MVLNKLQSYWAAAAAAGRIRGGLDGKNIFMQFKSWTPYILLLKTSRELKKQKKKFQLSFCLYYILCYAVILKKIGLLSDLF